MRPYVKLFRLRRDSLCALYSHDAPPFDDSSDTKVLTFINDYSLKLRNNHSPNVRNSRRSALFDRTTYRVEAIWEYARYETPFATFYRITKPSGTLALLTSEA